MLVGHERSEATEPINDPFSARVEKMWSVAVNPHTTGRHLIICIATYMGTPINNVNAQTVLGKSSCVSSTCKSSSNYQYGSHNPRFTLLANVSSSRC